MFSINYIFLVAISRISIPTFGHTYPVSPTFFTFTSKQGCVGETEIKTTIKAPPLIKIINKLLLNQSYFALFFYKTF